MKEVYIIMDVSTKKYYCEEYEDSMMDRYWSCSIEKARKYSSIEEAKSKATQHMKYDDDDFFEDRLMSINVYYEV